MAPDQVSVVDQLEKLSQLRGGGAISEEEYDQLKSRILRDQLTQGRHQRRALWKLIVWCLVWTVPIYIIVNFLDGFVSTLLGTPDKPITAIDDYLYLGIALLLSVVLTALGWLPGTVRK